MTIMHHTADIVWNIEMAYLSIRTCMETIYTLRADILPINTNVIISVKRVLHVVKPKGMHKLMNDRKESKTTTSNVVGLETESLWTSSSSHFGCTPNRVTGYWNKILFGRSIWKLETRSACEICSSLMNVIYLITICELANKCLKSETFDARVLTEKRFIYWVWHNVIRPPKKRITSAVKRRPFRHID